MCAQTAPRQALPRGAVAFLHYGGLCSRLDWGSRQAVPKGVTPTPLPLVSWRPSSCAPAGGNGYRGSRVPAGSLLGGFSRRYDAATLSIALTVKTLSGGSAMPHESSARWLIRWYGCLSQRACRRASPSLPRRRGLPAFLVVSSPIPRYSARSRCTGRRTCGLHSLAVSTTMKGEASPKNTQRSPMWTTCSPSPASSWIH